MYFSSFTWKIELSTTGKGECLARVAAYFCCALEPFCQVTGKETLIMSDCIAFYNLKIDNNLNKYTRSAKQPN